VRHASIRLYLVLAICGAEVFQLTSWDESQGKGIDDLLVGEKSASPADILQALINDAAPFIETLNNNVLDVSIVSAELAKIELPPPIRAHLAGKLGKKVGVPAKGTPAFE